MCYVLILIRNTYLCSYVRWRYICCEPQKGQEATATVRIIIIIIIISGKKGICYMSR